jgi:hypothetical protein
LRGDRDDANDHSTGNGTRVAAPGRPAAACQAIGVETPQELGFSAHHALSRKTAPQYLVGANFQSLKHSRADPIRIADTQMIDSLNIVEEYRRMNSADQATFHRCVTVFIVTAAFVVTIIAMIAINGMFWGGELKSANSAKYNQASHPVEEK